MSGVVADHASVLRHVAGSDPGRSHGRFLPPMLLLLASAPTSTTSAAAATASTCSASARAVAPTPLPGVVHCPLAKGAGPRTTVPLVVLLNGCCLLMCSHVLHAVGNCVTARLTWLRNSSRGPPISAMMLSHSKACHHPGLSAASTVIIDIPSLMRRPS